jgi:hypothetical protein
MGNGKVVRCSHGLWMDLYKGLEGVFDIFWWGVSAARKDFVEHNYLHV